MGARRRRSCFAVHCTVVAPVVSDGRAKQTQTQVNPSYQKYSTLPKFGNVVCVGHPSPQKGRSYVVTNAGWELRWTRAALKAGLLRAGRDEPREHGTNRIDGRRPCLRSLWWSGAMSCEALGEAGCLRTAKPCGPGRRCYGQAFAKASLRQPARCRAFRGGDGGKKELVSGESAA
jgi:hypothetical protein